jgi:hypothetical protein
VLHECGPLLGCLHAHSDAFSSSVLRNKLRVVHACCMKGLSWDVCLHAHSDAFSSSVLRDKLFFVSVGAASLLPWMLAKELLAE